MTRPTKPVQMCAVRIGYQTLLMPSEKGMKLVELLQSAFECEERYEKTRLFHIGDQPSVEFKMVKPAQIVPMHKPADECSQRLLA